MNPITAYVLYTYETAAGETGCRAYLYLDEPAAKTEGAKLKAEAPAETNGTFGFMVLPLEGAPA